MILVGILFSFMFIWSVILMAAATRAVNESKETKKQLKEFEEQILKMASLRRYRSYK